MASWKRKGALKSMIEKNNPRGQRDSKRDGYKFDRRLRDVLSPDSGTDAGSRWEIISAYINVLENCVSPVENESLLPFSKDVIRRAIYEELTVNPDSEFRGHLEIAFARLESFLPYDKFKVIREFKVVSSVALRMAGTGDPADILASARILKEAKGERAVKIQEKVSKRMRKRLAQIQGVGGAALLPT